MKVLVVDDEQLALDNLAFILAGFPEITEIATLDSPRKALEWLSANQPDAAFLDIDMQRMNGLSLAKRLKELCPNCAVVFVTGYAEYAVQAFELHVSGYLLKPVRPEKLRAEISHILQPRVVERKTGKTVRVQCFGNFEVFIHGAPARFRYSKSKELFAYLVDRKGAAASVGELCAVLWEDKPDSPGLKSQLRNSVSDITRCMAEAGVPDVLRKHRGSLAIDADALDCDYFGFLRMEPDAINRYRGEYMTQYSWAEMTLGGLEQLRQG